ncbi:hypothetical protein I552_8271 [Mycobacterium xenopi 3993]|nr:hypothetical protein I552_8271 [Mycobacterium xenopi 3993]
MGLYGNTSSPLDFTSDPGAKPDGVAPTVLTPPRQLQSLGGLTGLIDQTRKRFGDITGFRLVIYPDYAVIDRPTPTGTVASSATPTAAAGETRPPRRRPATPTPST